MVPTNAQQVFAYEKSQRLRATTEFQRCYSGMRAGDGHLLMFVCGNKSSRTRLGVSVSKKHGNAVARNRKKRLLREAFRLSQHELPAGLDIVLVPRQGADSTLKDFQASTKRLARRLATRLHKTDTPHAHQNGSP